ncbi:MAG: glycosyltransferase family 4 protein [Verrucomicrobiota bacterium]
MAKNIGFISTRFAGTDGVSLEADKWARVFGEDGHQNFWYSGRSDRARDISMCVPEAFFGHPENLWINEHIWGVTQRSGMVTDRIQELAWYIETTLRRFVRTFEIDIIVVENALTIPMHVPLGVALTQFLAETSLPTVCHHHDFYWERTRFSVNAVRDYLDMCFPSTLPNMRHTVINQAAQEQLALRKGTSSVLVPNVFAFEEDPPGIDDYNADFRREIGLAEEDIFILQPTRIVPRKGIEHAIKLVALMGDPRCKLIISHDAGDEGLQYQNELVDLARESGIDMRIVADRISERRQLDGQGRKMYTLWDLYPHADLVTYPSIYEGFGNALLEAFYFRKPVLINRYAIFVQDIEPKGFDLVVMDGYVTRKAADHVRYILTHREARERMTETNYQLACRYYGYNALRNRLRSVMDSL